MTDRVQTHQLLVDSELHEFVEEELLPGTGVESARLWSGLAELIEEFAPRNRELLATRDFLQSEIDTYHHNYPGRPVPDEYRAFLAQIKYLVPEPADFDITTLNVDPEISTTAGPQLVVPVLNARFATNAVNARWGSLYDALYGTDAITRTGKLAPTHEYNPQRGAEVIARGRHFLDSIAPLDAGSHAEAIAYRIDEDGLGVELASGETGRLIDQTLFIGYLGAPDLPQSILLEHHKLVVEAQFDRDHSIGKSDAAGMKDIVIESAVTAIIDFEDSVAAVDTGDKVVGYRNWLGLMRGDLTATVVKNGVEISRAMSPDRVFTAPDGANIVLPGRSLMLARHVGHHMMTDAVLDDSGSEVGEGILDAVFVTLGAMHDLRRDDGLKNSRTGSIYVVKPKMHGPEEVTFTVDLFARVESLLGLPAGTLKIGIMDEERRTSLNLKASIERAKDRVVFINTGFLDRTGDEIHTSLHAGPFGRKADLQQATFLSAYENQNVDVGLALGFPHRAQIGKGMWAMPDLMAEMLAQKGGHVRAGATTAWVPSPTAATLHALHYHEVDPFTAHGEIRKRANPGIDPILQIPLAESPDWTPTERREELDTNIQSILGYVVRWVDQGIGCSKVPDLANIALMEDRATLRISSQLLANWLHHGVISADDVDDSLRRIAVLVDAQNEADPLYEGLIGPEGPGLAYEAARDLVLTGAAQPNGYTEPILHRARRAKKLAAATAAS